MKKYYDEFLKNTISVWQPFSEKKLKPKDAYEITNNITCFFSQLLESDNKRKGGDNNSGFTNK